MFRSTAVIGIGSRCLPEQDENVGVAVVDRLRRKGVPETVMLATARAQPERIVELWSASRLALVVEPLTLPRADPGAVHRHEIDRRHPGAVDGTASENLGTAVRLAVDVDRLPGLLIAYIVEVDEHCFEWGMSARVNDAAERLAGLILADIAQFRPTPLFV